MSWKTGALFIGLLALALSLGIAAGSQASESTALSVENAGPYGAKVLFTWLKENGAKVSANQGDFTTLDPTIRTVVVTAPTVQPISDDEVEALEQFVTGGGTLIYLAPRGSSGARAGRALNRWLGVERGELPTIADDGALRDPAGLTVQATFQTGLLAGVSALRVAGERMISLKEGVPVTTPGALWFKAIGAGEVWVAAGPDLAENARLELLGNAQLWLNAAARGPMVLDELHHHAAVATPLTLNLIATALQFMACALLFVWARGRRLGPARPSLATAHRSSLEYVRAMGSLVGAAKLDGEVVAQLRADVRKVVHEVLGVSGELPVAQWSQEVSRATKIDAGELEQLFSRDEVLRVGQLAARVELALGR